MNTDLIIRLFKPAAVADNWIDFAIHWCPLSGYTLHHKSSGMSLLLRDKNVKRWIALLTQAATLKPQLP